MFINICVGVFGCQSIGKNLKSGLLECTGDCPFLVGESFISGNLLCFLLEMTCIVTIIIFTVIGGLGRVYF